jgi:hypothetical protein
MRRFLFLLAPVGLAAFASACEDDPSNNPATGFPEAGTFDASRDPSDSSTPQDGGPDAPIDPQGVTVVATGRTGPVANLTVLFHDAAGTITETKKTAADGRATSLPSPTPAMATIIFGEGTFSRRLLTWTAVADGDELPAIVPEDLNLGNVDVTLSSAAPDAGSSQYESFVGICSYYAGFVTEPWSMPVYQGCARGGGALLVRASDDADDTVGYAFKKPIMLDTDGGTLAATTGGWVAPVTVNLAVSNTTNISGTGVFSQIAGATPFTTSRPLGDAYSTSFESAGPTFADAYNAAASFPGASFNNERIIGRRVPTSTTSVTLDANTLPPELTGSSLDEADKRRPIAKWTGSTTGLKGGIVRLFFFDGVSDGATTGWTLVVPATASEIKVPALPASLDTILPIPDGGVYSWDPSPKVAFADSTLLPDYGAFRKIQGVLFPTIDEDPQLRDAVLPLAGDFKITSWTINNQR